jgi:hypothetical protein
MLNKQDEIGFMFRGTGILDYFQRFTILGLFVY